MALFVIDPLILGRRHHEAPGRLRFLRSGLEQLDEDLRQRGSRLVVRRGDPVDVVPGVAREAGADLVVATTERSPLGTARDRAVGDALAGARVAFRTFGGDLLADPDDIPGPNGHGYVVFTPFWRVWATRAIPASAPAPARLHGPDLASHGLDALPGGAPPVAAGAAAARARLEQFIRSGDADRYGERRDLLAEDATSRLSMYLRFGMASPAQIGRALRVATGASERTAIWRQLAWRDFYHHLMSRRPEVLTTAMRESLRDIAWEDDPAGWRAWTTGATGFPIVDAGMRQLAETGWMHNRARMVTASFLVKDLLIDWRRGETHFMRHLVDGDPASNNGGWQWVAGTGADAAPYFRIFNPTLQGERFDPDGEYVRRWVPELAGVPAAFVHEPWRMGDSDQRASGCRIGQDYPAPIVDRRLRREMTLRRYKDAERRAGAGEPTPG